MSDRFWTLIDGFGPATALVDPKRGPVTYTDLAREADATAQRLADLASRVGSPRLLVGCEIAPTAASIAAYLGALRGGHAVILGAPGDFAASTSITQRFAPNAVLSPITAGTGPDLRSREPAALHPDLCLMLSTSGSTGEPRLIRLSAESIDANARAIVTYLCLGPDDVAITSLPLHYSYGMSVLHSHLATGATLVLAQGSVTDRTFLDRARATGVTGLALVPHQVDLLIAAGTDLGDELPALRRVTQAGGRLAPETVRLMARTGRAEGWDFVVMYGQTEAGPRIAWLPPDRTLDASDCIGRAIPGGHLSLRAEDGSDVTGANIMGELVYRGPNVMLGYASSRADLALGRDVEELRTGDLAERTPEGLFRIVGRAARFVKLYGLRISLDRVEAMLAEAAIEGHAVAADDRLVIMTTRPRAAPSITALLADRLGLPETDIRVGALAEVPRLSNGKPDLRALERLARATLADGTEAAGSLTGAYRAATRVRRIAPTDTFLGLGGDSLAYLHVQLAIEARLGFVPPDWESMPIRDIEALAPVTPGRSAPVETSVLLRVLAMACIVTFHLTFWPVVGGTFLLILLCGWSFARFQSQALGEGALFRAARSMLVPLLPLYFLALVLFDLVRGDIPPEMYLLIGNIPVRLPVDLFEPYWFISLYAQMVAAVVLIAALPAARGLVRANPFRFGIVMTLATLAASVAFQVLVLGRTLVEVTEAPGTMNPVRSLPVALPFLFLGWSLFHADTPARKAFAGALVVPLLALFPNWGTSYIALVILGTVTLLSVRSVAVPAPLARGFQRLAAATMFVFLVHNVVVHVLVHVWPGRGAFGLIPLFLIGVPASFLLGLAAKAAFDRAERLLSAQGDRVRERAF